MSQPLRYLNIKNSDFKKLTNLFLDGKAYVYCNANNDICFGIEEDRKYYPKGALNDTYIILTEEYSCNIVVENNKIVMMSIARG